MEAKDKEKLDDELDCTEINFYKAILQEEVIRTTKNLVRTLSRVKIYSDLMKKRKSLASKDSQKHK